MSERMGISIGRIEYICGCVFTKYSQDPDWTLIEDCGKHYKKEFEKELLDELHRTFLPTS